VTRVLPGLGATLFGLALLFPASCSSREPAPSTYFERSISPILTTSCARANTGAGCHVTDARGNALGNLGLETFAGVDRRRDLLVDYGPYGQPGFLLKNTEPRAITVTTYDGAAVTVTTDIKHAGGSILDPSGSAYQILRRWISSGATENNTGQAPRSLERQPCNAFVPPRADFDLTRDPERADFGLFRDKVSPMLSGRGKDGSETTSCAAGNCHGTISNSLYLTCGDTPEQIRWNYFVAEEYLAQTPEQSELLRRPLSPSQGGAFHEGGVMFASTGDEGYRVLDEWARAHGPPELPEASAGFAFFSNKVQPMLVKKGCMMMQCHSATMFHDFRLRGGAGGTFSLNATRKNYELSLAQMSLESDDLDASRMVRKNLYRPGVCGVAGCEEPRGIAHRGGPLLEDFGGEAASARLCAEAAYDYDSGNIDEIPAYCVLGEWLRRERERAALAPLGAIVYVKRPLGGVRRAQDFDVYSPGADLRRVAASMGDGGQVTITGEDRSLTTGCGLDPATADIRRPQASWDGRRIAFAARASASEPLAVYEMNEDGSACQKHPDINRTPASENGLLVHNFDPTYAPPEGERSRIVFASTRGNLLPGNFDYQGPQRTPADPTKPNANLYSLDTGGAVRQLTFLLNLERQPSFMNDGRLIFTAEKRAPGFYQLALRRINLDSGDYHPLYAQRGSIGYPEATQVVELMDKDFAAIFSEPATPHGGGALGIFNRSLGIDFQSRDPADYPIDPAVLDPAALQSPDPAYFLRSLRFPDAAANARPGQPTSGLYTSPSALPNDVLLVSFGEAPDPDSFGGDYDVYAVNPSTGARVRLFGEAGSAEVDAIGVFARLPRPIFQSALDEPNGHTTVLPDRTEAVVHVLDFPVLASLLFQNTPTGRLVEPDLSHVVVYEDLPPAPGTDTFEKAGSDAVSDAFGRVIVRRRELGAAPVESDGSVRFSVPGGVPLVLRLPDTPLATELGLPRWQREQLVFSPGEYVNQSFKAEFFDGLCAQCHGAISGRPVDAALDVDFVTQASSTIARQRPVVEMNRPPSERSAVQGGAPEP
jgi:hypothetical protein